MHEITIIIVSWNSKDYLAQCLASIHASAPRRSFKIVVVDNGSSDGTVAFLQAHYPEIRCLENKENRGFAAANNQAIRLANSRYVLLLNPDTLVRTGALDAMAEMLDGDESVWAVGPSVLNADGTRQQTGVRYPTNWNVFVESFFLDRLFPNTRLFGRHKEFYEDATKPRAVDYVQGACLLVTSRAIQSVGILDERFFMYFEETDWCYRMTHAGGRVCYCPAARVVHFGGNAVGHFDEQRLVYYHRSLLLFYRKHYSAADRGVLRFILWIRSLVRILVWGGVYLLRPSIRAEALSSIRGYIHVLAGDINH
jgi:GT2 family glycosyltransferase